MGLSQSRAVVALVVISTPAASSLILPHARRTPIQLRGGSVVRAAAAATWSPQDLTADNCGYVPIPDDDYVKQYQRNPELWPVEFFVIPYRRREQRGTTTQVLVRASANGTSRWGLGTGVPVTRWVLSGGKLPRGYQWSEPAVTFCASNYPEFPKGEPPWSYSKIDICEDAFQGPDALDVSDAALAEYANEIRDGLRARLSEQISVDGSSWEATTAATVQRILARPNSRAAIQGTLRMSGLPIHAIDPAKLVESMRIFTMFPQMPDPMPLPSTPAEELKQELLSRASRMAASGRDPHADKHGRAFTHTSTNNVSNTIIGIYLLVDATALPGLEDVPAFDLFGSTPIPREWVSLQDLKVLEADGVTLGTEDTKPTFISGFIVRQLVREGAIALD